MPVPAATNSTTRDPSVWDRVKPRVNTDEPASENATVIGWLPMSQLTRVNPMTAMVSHVVTSTIRATGSLRASTRSLAVNVRASMATRRNTAWVATIG